MAQATTSILLSALRGKAGSVVFVNTKTGVTVRARNTPANPQTPLQQATRQAMHRASALFSSFDPSTVKMWNDYARTLKTFDERSGKLKCPSGQNVFAGLACKLWQMDTGQDVPLSPPASAFLGDGIRVDASVNGSVIVFNASGPNSASVVTELLTQPLKSGARTPQGRAYRTASFVTMTPRFPFGVVEGLTGWVACAVRFVNTDTGQQSQVLELGVVQVGDGAGTKPAPPAPQVWGEPPSGRCVCRKAAGNTLRSNNTMQRNVAPHTWGAGGASSHPACGGGGACSFARSGNGENAPPSTNTAGYNRAMTRFLTPFRFPHYWGIGGRSRPHYWGLGGLLTLLVLCAFVGKTHAAPNAWHFIAYGDTRSHPEDHAAVIRAIVALHPEFVLQSGDLVSDGGSPKQWTEFDGIIAPLRSAKIGYYPARGNHDLGRYYIREVREPYDSGTGYYYAFTRHGARFIMVDSLDPAGFAPGTNQRAWLVTELEKAHTAGQLCFVCFHEAPFSVGPHGPTPEAQRLLHPLFVRFKPTAVFCGHDHLYYRTVRNGVLYFVTGGGGAPLYTPDKRGFAVAGDVFCSTHHVIECDVVGRKVAFTAVSLDGTGGTKTDAPPLLYHVGADGRQNSVRLGPVSGQTLDRVTAGK